MNAPRSQPAQALLEVRDLRVRFLTDDGPLLALAGVSFMVRRGETLGLVGESGCGKSVAALSIMRLIPDPPGRIVQGEIIFDGRDLLRLDERQMHQVRGDRVAMIFQEPLTCLNPVARVGDQVAEAFRLHRSVSRGEARLRAVDMLRRVGIPDPARRAREYPHHLSGGMRQRVMIAMALALRPGLIIADEQTTALDVTIQAQILELMNQLKREFDTSIMLITHDLGVIAETAQRVAVMYAGRIVEHAWVGDLFDRPAHPYTQGLLESRPDADDPGAAQPRPGRRLKAIPGLVPSLLDLPTGCAFQDRCGRVFDRCRAEEPPLFELGGGHQARCWLHG